MTAKSLENLDYLKALAEEGRSAPLLGGGIGLMWAILLIGTLLIHGVLADMGAPFGGLEFPILWVIFSVTGSVVSTLMGRRLNGRAGANNLGNMLEARLWTLAAFIIFSFAITVAIGNAVGSLDQSAFGFMMPVAFALYALNYGVLAKFSGASIAQFGVVAAFVSMVVTTLLAMSTTLYYASAVGVFFALALPSIISMREARA